MLKGISHRSRAVLTNTGAFTVGQDSLGPLLGVLWKSGIVEQLRLGAQSHDISNKSDRLLTCRVTIANVGPDDLLKRFLDTAFHLILNLHGS